MMLKRLLSGSVLGAIVFAVTWYGGLVFSIALAVIAALGAFEFYKIIDISKKQPLAIIGTIGVLLFILVAHFEMKYTTTLLAAVIVLPLIWAIFQPDTKNAASNWAWLLAGMLYIGWMLSHFIPLRALDGGRDWALLAIITCVACDITAFVIGSKWGRHRMIPRISPSKTWEGTVGGFIGAVAAALILATILPTIDIPYWQAAVLGMLVGIFGPLGDLAESMLKRNAGVKDSGHMVPGHGGMLDRMDSILFTVVVVYYYVIWVVM
ncbi:MAG: phosphatidate cytidylyltransferase [Chloroflexota bacterium]|nr:phosphatidate cytidylyltransferase [Chloroflexota bacterium]